MYSGATGEQPQKDSRLFMSDKEDDFRAPTAAEQAMIYAQAAEIFTRAITQNVVNSNYEKCTEEQKKLFMTCASAAAHRMQREIDPRYITQGPAQHDHPTLQ